MAEFLDMMVGGGGAMERRRVILYGQSIILSSVGASLRRYASLEVVPLAAPRATALSNWSLRAMPTHMALTKGLPS